MKRYAVVDVETTGGSFRLDKVIEIGIVLMEDDEITETYQKLIYPERSIPYQITMLTGISDEMVADAPRFYEIAADIVRLTEDRIFVAHNATFDYNFIKSEFDQLGYVFTRKILDTVKLSRLAFPGHKSYSLSNLISIFQLQIADRHRALDDAYVTAEIFQKVIRTGTFVGTQDDYIRMAIKNSSLPPTITIQDILNIPADNGVYYFFNEETLIYVGKSKNIKSRVAQHFSDHSEKAAKLRQSTTRIEYEATTNELIALIKESIEIRQHKPIYNKAQRNTSYPYHSWYESNDDKLIKFGVSKAGSLKAGQQLLRYFSHKKIADNHILHLHEKILNHLNESIEDEEEKSLLINLFSGLIGTEGSNNYFRLNSIVQEYVTSIVPVFEKDFIILDPNDQKPEKTAILIYEGRYHGYGIIEQSFGMSETAQWTDVIPRHTYSPELDLIINSYIRKYPNKVRIVELKNQRQYE